MKRTVVVVSLFVLLFVFRSSRAEEHGSGSAGGRPTATTPQVDAQSRLFELTSACFAGRPFPAREFVQIPSPTQTQGSSADSAPTLPSASASSNSANTGASTQASTQAVPSSTNSAAAGAAALTKNCMTCHHQGMPPEYFKSRAADVERRMNLPLTDKEHMPKGGNLSAEEKAAIIAFVKGQ